MELEEELEEELRAKVAKRIALKKTYQGKIAKVQDKVLKVQSNIRNKIVYKAQSSQTQLDGKITKLVADLAALQEEHRRLSAKRNKLEKGYCDTVVETLGLDEEIAQNKIVEARHVPQRSKYLRPGHEAHTEVLSKEAEIADAECELAAELGNKGAKLVADLSALQEEHRDLLAKRDALKASCLSRIVQFEIEENSLQRQIVEERAMVQKRKRFKPIDWSLIEVPSTETVEAGRALARGAKSSDKTKPASWGPQQQKGDQDGNTALIRAATNGDVDIVINLISRGANKEHKNKDGKTALDCAKENKHDKIFALLKQHAFMGETGRELEAIREYEHKLRDRLIYLDVEEGRLARMIDLDTTNPEEREDISKQSDQCDVEMSDVALRLQETARRIMDTRLKKKTDRDLYVLLTNKDCTATSAKQLVEKRAAIGKNCKLARKGSDVIEEKERLIAKLMRDVQSDRENSYGRTQTISSRINRLNATLEALDALAMIQAALARPTRTVTST